jgi:hypothetical protein
MRRIHAFTIAVVPGAALAGMFAATRTTQLGPRRRPGSDGSDREAKPAARQDRKALLAGSPRTDAVTAAQTVVYVRPKPIHVVHRKGGEHDESEGESGRDD